AGDGLAPPQDGVEELRHTAISPGPPTRLRRVPHLLFEAGELLQALLERRVRREQRREAEALREGRCEEKGVEGFGAAQVPGWDLAHGARHLGERRGQGRRGGDED